MSVQYAPSKLRVPDGFNNLLEGLAREVLREQPENIINFAAEYFKTQLTLRDGDETVENGVNGSAVAEETPKEAVTEQQTEEKPKDQETPDEPKKENETTLSEDDAATKIQAVVRGKKARDDVKAMKSDKESSPTPEVTEQQTTATEESAAEESKTETEGEGEQEASAEEQEAAALKIQSSFRGMKARKEVEAMKSEKSDEQKPQDESAAEPTESTDPPAEN